ncbi:MAG: glycosyltransferase family 4 protein [Candidatus Methanoperedens sp.]|nr:glycosyltransferase family 4 protein [Candidatus Methanoperedens sp.]
MNIALLAPEFMPNWGGAGTYIIGLAKNLSKKHNVHVVTVRRKIDNGSVYSDENILDFFENKIQLHTISNANDTFLYNATFQYSCFKQLPIICKENKIDIVHADVPHMSDVMLRLLKSNKNMVTTVHTIIEGHKQGILASGLDFNQMEASERFTLELYPFLKLIQRLYLKRSPTIIAVSNWMKGLLEQNYGIKDVNVIHNGIDHEQFSPKRRNIAEGLETNKPIVLFSGRFIALKGINILVRAMRTVISETKDVHFAFAGPEANIKWVKMFENEGIPSHFYTFLGYIPHSEMPEIYSNASIFVLPSLIESFPFSILEAMSSGVPVIASNVGGVPEMIDDEVDGLLVPPGNPEILAKKLLFLLDNESERKKISKKAREKILGKFTSEIMTDKTEKIYEQILKDTI